MTTDRSALDETYAELVLRIRQLDAIRTISAAVYSTTDPDELVRLCLEASLEVVGCQAGSVILYDRERGKLVFRDAVGPRAEEIIGFEMAPDEGIAGRVFRSGRIEVSEDVQSDPGHYRAVGDKIDLVTHDMVTVPLKQADGEIIGVMQVLNRRGGPFTTQDLDVLEIVANQAAMAIDHARLHQEARLAEVVKLIGDIAHEVKNFMTPVSSGIKTLEMVYDQSIEETERAIADPLAVAPEEMAAKVKAALEPLREFFPEAVEMVLDGAAQVTGRAREIADCIKGEVSHPTFQLASVDDVARSVVKLQRHVADRAGITLDLEGLGAPPLAPIDPKLVHSALYNLVGNAIPETPEGGVVAISTSARTDGEWPDGSYVQIVVRDNGRGMPPHIRDKLFSKDAVSTKPTGTGLGTRIIKNAVDAHGGVITVESEPGKGSTFTIRLPLARPHG